MSTRVVGRIRGLGSRYEGEDLERQEIWVDKRSAEGLPYREGERVPMELRIGGERYRAGIRTTPRQKFVYISPDLECSNGEPVSLASVLHKHRFEQNEEVVLDVEGHRVTLLRSSDLAT